MHRIEVLLDICSQLKSVLFSQGKKKLKSILVIVFCSDCKKFLIIMHLVTVNRYIAKTLYGDDDEEVPPQNNNVEEPKLLGINPVSSEKVCIKFWS